MTQLPEDLIHGEISSLISPQRIRRKARELKVVKRRRKVDVVALVYTLIFGFASGRQRNFASLRRAYEMATGVTMAPSAFYDRFTPELAELMRSLTLHAFAQLAQGTSKLHKTLAAFSNVFIADGSLIRLHDALAADFPSVWTNHTKAGVKLHVIMNGASRTPEILDIAPGSAHDLRLMSVGPWCQGSLCLFDLAYFQGRLFSKIIDQNGHFLCRVRDDANMFITGAADETLVGKKTREALSLMSGKSFEVEVSHAYRHARAGDYRTRSLKLRFVAVWHAEAKRHRPYLTSSHALSIDAIAAVYAMRWEIELLFRELKSQLRIDEIPTGNKAAFQCLLYAALLSLAVGRCLHRVLQLEAADHWPFERWSILLRHVAHSLLVVMLAGPILRRLLGARLLSFLRVEALDPNRHRMLLVQRAQEGVLAA